MPEAPVSSRHSAHTTSAHTGKYSLVQSVWPSAVIVKDEQTVFLTTVWKWSGPSHLKIYCQYVLFFAACFGRLHHHQMNTNIHNTIWEGNCKLTLQLMSFTVNLTKGDVYFTFMWPCIVTNFFIIKPTDAQVPKFMWLKNEPQHVSGSSSAQRNCPQHVEVYF